MSTLILSAESSLEGWPRVRELSDGNARARVARILRKWAHGGEDATPAKIRGRRGYFDCGMRKFANDAPRKRESAGRNLGRILSQDQEEDEVGGDVAAANIQAPKRDLMGKTRQSRSKAPFPPCWRERCSR